MTKATTTETGTAVAKKTLTFDGLMERMKPQIEAVLPKHIRAERMLALCALAATKVPKLRECTPLSLFNAIVTASRLGLEIGQHAHLVPFRNSRAGVTECVFIPDYRGLIHLAVSSGHVKHIDARVVYGGDHFEYELGDKPHIRHVPKMGNDRSPENIVAFYCVAHLSDNTKVFDEPMSKREVDALRARSRAGQDGPWVTDYVMMGKKSAVKRFCKYLPQTPELFAAIEADNRAETGEVTNVSDIIDSPASINQAVADSTRGRLEDLKREMGAGAASDPAEASGANVGPASGPAPSPAKAHDEGMPY